MEQLTLSIIKPDAMRRQLATTINNKIKAAGLKIIAQKTIQLTTEQAQRFYAVHKNRPFFNELVAIMTERSVLVQVLAGKNAIERYRQLLGATDPAKADAGTIRKDHGVSVGENSAHGSDSEENAANEVAFFFSGIELMA